MLFQPGFRFALAASWLLSPAWAGLSFAAAPPTQEQIAKWIIQLGSPNHMEREVATSELKKDLSAARAVREATQSNDPEVARRASAILQELERLSVMHQSGPIRKTIENREVDRFVELASRYAGPRDLIWQAATDLGWSQAGLVIERFGDWRGEKWMKKIVPDRVFSKMDSREYHVLPSNARAATVNGSFLFNGRSLVAEPGAVPLIAIVNGSVEAEGISGIVFVNGDLQIPGRRSPAPAGIKVEYGSYLSGVVVCDGNVTLPVPIPGRQTVTEHKIRAALLVSNGTVRCPVSIRSSVILASGDVFLPERSTCFDVVIRAGGKIHRPKRGDFVNCTIEENVANPTKPFRFFELSQLGLAAAPAVGGIVVERVVEQSSLAAAGLRSGDLITAIDGKQANSLATLRRSLRAATIVGDCTLRVKRGQETVRLPVRFP